MAIPETKPSERIIGKLDRGGFSEHEQRLDRLTALRGLPPGSGHGWLWRAVGLVLEELDDLDRRLDALEMDSEGRK